MGYLRKAVVQGVGNQMRETAEERSPLDRSLGEIFGKYPNRDSLIQDRGIRFRLYDVLKLAVFELRERHGRIAELEAFLRDSLGALEYMAAFRCDHPGACGVGAVCNSCWTRGWAKNALAAMEKLLGPVEKGGVPGFGVDGVRDPDCPCEGFESGGRRPSADCDTDGHYLCDECANKKEPEKPEEQ